MKANNSKKTTQHTQLNRKFTHLILCSLAAFLISCTSSDASTNTEPLTTETHETATDKQYKLGEQAPDFTLLDLNGNQRSLSDYRGKFLVIHFATTWCPFCNAEAPYLEKIYNDLKSKGVEVMIIDVKEGKDLVQEKLQDRFNFTFPLLLDEDGQVASSYAPEGVLPDLARDEVALASNLLIDPEGKIQFYSLLDSQNFDAELIGLQDRLHELL